MLRAVDVNLGVPRILIIDSLTTTFLTMTQIQIQIQSSQISSKWF